MKLPALLLYLRFSDVKPVEITVERWQAMVKQALTQKDTLCPVVQEEDE